MRLYKYWHKSNRYLVMSTYRLDCIDSSIEVGSLKSLLMWLGFTVRVKDFYIRRAKKNEK